MATPTRCTATLDSSRSTICKVRRTIPPRCHSALWPRLVFLCRCSCALRCRHRALPHPIFAPPPRLDGVAVEQRAVTTPRRAGFLNRRFGRVRPICDMVFRPEPSCPSLTTPTRPQRFYHPHPTLHDRVRRHFPSRKPIRRHLHLWLVFFFSSFSRLAPLPPPPRSLSPRAPLVLFSILVTLTPWFGICYPPSSAPQLETPTPSLRADLLIPGAPPFLAFCPTPRHSSCYPFFAVLIIDAIAEIGEPAGFDQILNSVSSVRCSPSEKRRRKKKKVAPRPATPPAHPAPYQIAARREVLRAVLVCVRPASACQGFEASFFVLPRPPVPVLLLSTTLTGDFGACRPAVGC